MAAFAKFGSDLDVSTQRLLARGERLTELLKQPQYAPLQAEEQVCVLYAGTRGYLDRIPVAQVLNFQSELLTRLRGQTGGILDRIRTSKALAPDTEEDLKAVLESVAQTFA
jgi:F-type H+-transporting ATPase subunit alpha